MSTTTVDYQDFLRAKADFETDYGQPVPATAVNPILKEHQRDIVRWAVQGGRRAIFAAFGMGKSMIQLETLKLTLSHAGGKALIIAPLGVRGEFIRDGRKLDIDVTFIRRAEDITGDGIYITNYETVRDGKLDVNEFTAVSLDEAGVLRSFGSKTYQTFLTLFDKVKYKFVATATPSPNRYKELIHYAGFLGVMDTGQALTRWFQRDSTQANNLTLYPHKRDEFFMWLNSWSIFLQKPSDLGYSDEGYDLPPLNIDWCEVPVDHSTAGVDRDGQVRLFRGGAKDLQGVAKEKRDSLPARIAKLTDMVLKHHAKDDGQIILWCDLNDEQSAIEAALKTAGISYSSVHGSLDTDEAERRLDIWRDKETYALIGKPVMLGQGLNLQQSNVAIFARRHLQVQRHHPGMPPHPALRADTAMHRAPDPRRIRRRGGDSPERQMGATQRVDLHHDRHHQDLRALPELDHRSPHPLHGHRTHRSIRRRMDPRKQRLR